jgi:hypothetical protein
MRLTSFSKAPRISRWLADRHFLPADRHAHRGRQSRDAIAEGGRIAIEILVDFSLDVLNALLAAVSFIRILGVVGADGINTASRKLGFVGIL